MPKDLLAALAAVLAAAPVLPQSGKRAELVPAGSINSILHRPDIVFVVQDEPRILKYATAIRDQFFEGAKLLKAKQAVAQDLSRSTLVVYGTPEGNAWLAKHADRLPFRFGKDRVELGRAFEGRRLRVICTVRNPDNENRRALIYTAARGADVVGLNSVFHGPTEWVVADGGRTLASGNFEVARTLSAAELGRDLDFLVGKIRENHPCTVGRTPEELTMAIERARRSITKPTGRKEFWLVANGVLVPLHDAHSGMSPLATSERIDLPLVWLEEGLIVSEDTNSLAKGDRILAIGKHDEKQLLAVLRGVVPAENDGWIKSIGERALGDLGVLRILGIAEAAPVHIEVERDGKSRSVSLAVPTRPRAGKRRRPWVRFEIDERSSLGVFTLDACRVNETYSRTLHAFFRAVHEKDIERVAVDVRNNSGGNSAVLNQFLHYVDVDAYDDYSGEVRETEDSLAQRGKTGKPGFRRYGKTRRENRKRRDPPPFDGTLYVLTSKATFSSGNWFAVVLQDNGLAEVLGEATGNAPSSYGDILTFTLPESGYSFHVSYKRWVRPDPSRDPADSLVPDRVLALTRQDVIDGRDPVLEYLRGGKGKR